MHYPAIDSVLVNIGPLAIRWYGLSYLAGFLICWWLGRYRAARLSAWGEPWSNDDISDLVFYGALGAVLGGRVGYVLFYGFDQFLADPLWLFRIWEGGMASHGGMIGVMLAFAWFARRTGRTFLQVADFMAPLCPPGLGLGRLANFINTELPGRVTDSPFGLIYPCDAVYAHNRLCLGEWEDVARHPSPLYQAFAEGLLLFVLLWWFARKPRGRGQVAGLFLFAYGVFRLCTEFFRAPDPQLGLVALDALSMGQILSIPMIIAGILLLVWGRSRPTARDQASPQHTS